jgi:hypothetical protein
MRMIINAFTSISVLVFFVLGPVIGFVIVLILLARGTNIQEHSVWQQVRGMSFLENIGLVLASALAFGIPLVIIFVVIIALEDWLEKVRPSTQVSTASSSFDFSLLGQAMQYSFYLGLLIVISIVFFRGIVSFPVTQLHISTVRSLYGNNAFDLCSTIDSSQSSITASANKGSPPKGSKLIFLWESGKNGSVLWSGVFPEPYNQMLPAEYKATGKDDITAVVCLKDLDNELAPVTYSGGSTCTRYVTDILATIFIVETKELLAKKNFPGSIPICPQLTSASISPRGDLSPPGVIVNWVVATVG